MKLYKLTWRYHAVNNPQTVLCSSRREAKSIIKTVRRFAKDLMPTEFLIELKRKQS